MRNGIGFFTFNVLMIAIALVLLGRTVRGQDPNAPPVPIPDPATNAAPQDFHRVDGFAFEKEKVNRKNQLPKNAVGGPISDVIVERATDRIAKLHEGRLGKIAEDLRALRAERNGLIARITSLATSLAETREEARKARAEAKERWQPIKNLANLVKWTFWLLVLLCVLFSLDRVSSIFKRS